MGEKIRGKLKVCKRCLNNKNVNDFCKSVIAPGGRVSWCRECHRLYNKEMRDKINKEKPRYIHNNVWKEMKIDLQLRQAHLKCKFSLDDQECQLI